MWDVEENGYTDGFKSYLYCYSTDRIIRELLKSLPKMIETGTFLHIIPTATWRPAMLLASLEVDAKSHIDAATGMKSKERKKRKVFSISLRSGRPIPRPCINREKDD
jgi:hypothetical protein